MNKRQWRTLVLGVVATVSVLAFGTSRPRPTSAGPLVEYAPGQYRQEFTDAVLPIWVLLAALALMVLTGAALYRSRSQNTD